MHIHFTIDDDQKNIGEGLIQVGWFLTEEKSSILYESPYRIRSQSQTKHAKSASCCPAVLQLESLYFIVSLMAMTLHVLSSFCKLKKLQNSCITWMKFRPSTLLTLKS